MSAAAPHPLDTDLLDLVEGMLPPEVARAVEEHLATCILCRIKHQRLRDEPPIDPVEPGEPIGPVDRDELAIPTFGPVDAVDAPPAGARPGQLWLTGGEEALMVLVRATLDPLPGLVVVPVTFDTEAADIGTLVLDAGSSPLGVPLAIHGGMASGLPREALRSRVVPVREVDLLALEAGAPGVGPGRPLAGPDDPRHEVRQRIADRLAALTPVDPAPAPSATDDPDEPDGRTFALVRHQLADLRHGGTTVEPFATPGGCPDGWVGLGRVLDRHLSLLVIGTPAGLVTEADYLAARGLAVRWHASALVVCPGHGATVDLYTPKGLYDAMQVPLGQRSPEPTVSGLDLVDSVRKFLDLHPLWHVPAASGARPVHSVDVTALLERHARDAAARLAERNVRGAGKPEAYRRASRHGEQLAAALRQALHGTLAPEDIEAVAGGDADGGSGRERA